MKSLLYSCLFCWVCLGVAIAEDQHRPTTYTLTTENFDSSIQKGAWFVKFFAPWCGHCKRIEPTWNILGASLSHLNVHIASVDCTVDRDLCTKHGVRGYPSLILFQEGSLVAEYESKRDVRNLLKFLVAKNALTSQAHNTLDIDKMIEASNSTEAEEPNNWKLLLIIGGVSAVVALIVVVLLRTFSSDDTEDETKNLVLVADFDSPVSHGSLALLRLLGRPFQTVDINSKHEFARAIRESSGSEKDARVTNRVCVVTDGDVQWGVCSVLREISLLFPPDSPVNKEPSTKVVSKHTPSGLMPLTRTTLLPPKCEEVLQWAQNHLEPVVLAVCEDPPLPTVTQKGIEAIPRVIGHIEQLLQANSFLCGSYPTTADFAVVSLLTLLEFKHPVPIPEPLVQYSRRFSTQYTPDSATDAQAHTPPSIDDQDETSKKEN